MLGSTFIQSHSFVRWAYVQLKRLYFIQSDGSPSIMVSDGKYAMLHVDRSSDCLTDAWIHTGLDAIPTRAWWKAFPAVSTSYIETCMYADGVALRKAMHAVPAQLWFRSSARAVRADMVSLTEQQKHPVDQALDIYHMSVQSPNRQHPSIKLVCLHHHGVPVLQSTCGNGELITKTWDDR